MSVFRTFDKEHTGLALKITGTRSCVINSQYMIGNINIAALVTGNSQVTLNNLYEGSPGNTDSPVNSPVTSLKVDSGSKVVLISPTTTEPMILASDTTTILSDYIKSAIVATSGRPTASSVGNGAMLYDSTLGKPIWSNGSVWKDASGTTV